MPKTEYYQLSGNLTIQDIEIQLNRILNQISDRIDKIEGNRGISTIQDGLTIENTGVIVHGINTSGEV